MKKNEQIKLTLTVSMKEANELIRSMINNAEWAEDEHFNRLPKDERISRALKCRELVQQLLPYAVNDGMSDILSQCADLSDRIDRAINDIKSEEEKV